MAKEAAESPCGGADPEAVTALAALGLLPDATAAVKAATCPGNSYLQHAAEMNRARIFGRLAVAQKLSSRDVEPELLDRAIRLADDAFRTGQHLTTSHPYDTEFADVTCDLAQDFLLIGDRAAAQSLARNAHDTPPYFASLCLGRLAGVLYRLSSADEAHALLEQALSPSASPLAGNYPAYARGGFANGLYDGSHIDEILQDIDSIGMAGFRSAFDLGRFRLDAYTAFAHQEIASRHWVGSWRIIKAAWTENSGRPTPALDDLLFAMAASGMPGDSRTVFAQIQEAIAATPGVRLFPSLRAALGSAFLASGNPTQAEAQFDAARGDMARLPNGLRESSMQELVHAYAAGGDLQRASELVEQIFPPATDPLAHSRRLLALRDIALAAVQAGKEVAGGIRTVR